MTVHHSKASPYQPGYVTNVIMNNKLILECGIVLKAIGIIIYTTGYRKYIRCM